MEGKSEKEKKIQMGVKRQQAAIPIKICKWNKKKKESDQSLNFSIKRHLRI